MNKKESILNAGAKLFARRSYNSVGIRDIASEARVNSAMISYYFGGKVGLLREIFLRFHDLFMFECVLAINDAACIEDIIVNFVNGILDNARQNQDIYLVGLKELNHDSDELQDLRDDLHEKSNAVFIENTERLGIKLPENNVESSIGFTATLGLIFSDYLLGGCSCVNDDEHHAIYKQTVSHMLIQGMPVYWS